MTLFRGGHRLSIEAVNPVQGADDLDPGPTPGPSPGPAPVPLPVPPPPPVPRPREGASANPEMTPVVGNRAATVWTGATSVGGGGGARTGVITEGVGGVAFIASVRGGVGIELPPPPPPPPRPGNSANIRSMRSAMIRGRSAGSGPIDMTASTMNRPIPCRTRDAAHARPVVTRWLIKRRIRRTRRRIGRGPAMLVA